MKLKHFFYAGVFAVGITACSDNEEIGNAQTPTEANVYMTLQIVGPQGMNSRTTPELPPTEGTESGDIEVGTSEENTISNVTILLCDASTHETVATFSSSNFTLTETDKNGVVTSPIAIPESVTLGKAYDVYVIANDPSTSILSSSDNVTSKVIEGITMNDMKNTYAQDNHFVMFNECNDKDKIGGVSITITDNNTYDNPARCAEPIKLDRLAVKIRSQVKKENEKESIDIDGINGEEGELNVVENVTLKGFKLLNGATKTNLQQKWTAATTGTYPWVNTLITPVLGAGSSTNAESGVGYYNHLSDFRTITKGIGNSYTVVKDTYASVDAYNDSNPTADIYCMENNPTWDGSKIVDALNGNTTGLVYQWGVTIKDKEGQAGTSESDELAGENCFYSYDGKYYATLDALIADYPGVLDKATGTSADEKKKAIKDELSKAYKKTAGEERETAISDFRVKYNIKVYTEGIMYYTYFIKDQNYKQGESTKEEHYYSVMRNTVYDLTVTALQRIGTDIPGGWNPDKDPEDPVDPTNVYMVVEAQANPWVVSSEDITLQ